MKKNERNDNDEQDVFTDRDEEDNIADYGAEDVQEIVDGLDVSVKDVIDELASIVASLRKIVKYVKKSTIVKDYLDKLQRQNGNPHPVALDLDVQTRWNLTLALMQKALLLKDEIQTFLHHLTTASGKREFNCVWLPCITDENWCMIHAVSILLQPFASATSKLSGEKYPSFVQAMPML